MGYMPEPLQECLEFYPIKVAENLVEGMPTFWNPKRRRAPASISQTPDVDVAPLGNIKHV